MAVTFSHTCTSHGGRRNLVRFASVRRCILSVLMSGATRKFAPRQTKRFPSSTTQRLRGGCGRVVVSRCRSAGSIRRLVTALLSGNEGHFVMNSIGRSVCHFHRTSPAVFRGGCEDFSSSRGTRSEHVSLGQGFHDSTTVLTSVGCVFHRLVDRGLLRLSCNSQRTLCPKHRRSSHPTTCTNNTIRIRFVSGMASRGAIPVSRSIGSVADVAFRNQLVTGGVHTLVRRGQRIVGGSNAFHSASCDSVIVLLHDVSGGTPTLLGMLGRRRVPTATSGSSSFVHSVRIRVL